MQAISLLSPTTATTTTARHDNHTQKHQQYQQQQPYSTHPITTTNNINTTSTSSSESMPLSSIISSNTSHLHPSSPLTPTTQSSRIERVLVNKQLEQQQQQPHKQQSTTVGGAKRFFVSRIHPQQLLLAQQQQLKKQQPAEQHQKAAMQMHIEEEDTIEFSQSEAEEQEKKKNKTKTGEEPGEELICFRYTWPVRITERRIGPDEFAILNVSPPFCTAHNGVQFTWLLRICEENIIDIGGSGAGDDTLGPPNENNKLRLVDDNVVDYIDDDLVEFGGGQQMAKKKVNITLYYKEGPARDVKLHAGIISIQNSNGLLFDQMPLRELEYTKGGGWSPICAASLSRFISAEQRKFSEFIHGHVGRQITVRVKLEMPASLFQPMQYLPSIDSPISGKLEGLCAAVLDEIRANKLPVPDVQYFDPDTDKYALYRHVYQFACHEICRRFIKKNNPSEIGDLLEEHQQSHSELMEKISNIFAYYYFNTVIVREAECFEDFLEALDASRHVQFPALRRECERYICTEVMAESADLTLVKKMLLLAERFNLPVLKMVSFGVIVDRLLQLPQQDANIKMDGRRKSTITVQNSHKISTASSENGGSDSGAISGGGGMYYQQYADNDDVDDDDQQQRRKKDGGGGNSGNNHYAHQHHNQHMLQRSADSGMTMESSMDEIREEMLEIAEQIFNPIEHHPSTSSSNSNYNSSQQPHQQLQSRNSKVAAPIVQSNRQHSKSLCSPKLLSSSSSGSSADEENSSEDEDEEAESDPGGETLVGSVITQLEELARHIRKVSMPPGVRPAPAQNNGTTSPDLVQHSPISTDSGNGSSSVVDSRRSSLKTARETLLHQHRLGRSNSGSVSNSSAAKGGGNFAGFCNGNSFFSQLYATASSSNESVQRQRCEQRCNSDTWASHLHSGYNNTTCSSNSTNNNNSRKNMQFVRQMHHPAGEGQLLEEEEQCNQQQQQANNGTGNGPAAADRAVTVIHFHPSMQKAAGSNRRNVALVQKACSKLFAARQQKIRVGHRQSSSPPPPQYGQQNDDEEEEE